MVLTADFLLAAGFAGADSVSTCVADSIAVSNCRDGGRGSFGVVARNFLFAGARVARSAGSVKVTECRGVGFRVIP